VIRKAMMSCERGGGRGFEAFQVFSFSERHFGSRVKVNRSLYGHWAVGDTVQGCRSEG
jgi:hypothetical protein